MEERQREKGGMRGGVILCVSCSRRGRREPMKIISARPGSEVKRRSAKRGRVERKE
jgi:hypothetical protein